MKSNIDKLWERDSQIEDLLEKTELLETETKVFKTNTGKLASKFWWKNFKIWVIIIVVVIVLVWLIASLICGFRFQCLTKAGKCFHVDSLVNVEGKSYNLEGLRSLSECLVPHVVEARGVSVATTCGTRLLRLTADHLVLTATRGFREAGSLVAGELLYGDAAKQRMCKVVSVTAESVTQSYFGLNCPTADSLVVADGVLVSTFGHLHHLPAMWIKYASKILGLQRASRIGELVSNIYLALVQ